MEMSGKRSSLEGTVYQQEDLQTNPLIVKIILSSFPLRTRVLQLLAIEPISLEFLIKKLSLTNTQDLKSIIPNFVVQILIQILWFFVQNFMAKLK